VRASKPNAVDCRNAACVLAQAQDAIPVAGFQCGFQTHALQEFVGAGFRHLIEQPELVWGVLSHRGQRKRTEQRGSMVARKLVTMFNA
jgi:hypothetical protein